MSNIKELGGQLVSFASLRGALRAGLALTLVSSTVLGVGCDDSDGETGDDVKAAAGKPAAPTELKVETREGKAFVTWVDNTPDEYHFMLARRRDGEAYDGFIHHYPDPNETSFIDEDIESGILYFYRIQSMWEDGTLSDWSNEASYMHP